MLQRGADLCLLRDLYWHLHGHTSKLDVRFRAAPPQLGLALVAPDPWVKWLALARAALIVAPEVLMVVCSLGRQTASR